MSATITKEDAEHQGAEAYRALLGGDANPYRYDSDPDLYLAWREGWETECALLEDDDDPYDD